jgi:polar amino acid transport system substrate-binding protein
LLRLEPIITHRFSFVQAEAAYAQVRERDSGRAMGILLEYDATAPLETRVAVRPAASSPRGAVVLGVIGAGTFVRNTLLPALKAQGNVRFRAVANATGLSARNAADRFSFENAGAAHEDVLNDPAINTVLIGTRHDTHAAYTVAALRAGKAVFVEKPLALSRQELADVEAATAQGGSSLMVGFNRRFAPATQKIRELFARHSEPLALTYRVNAGFLAKEHWIQDSVLGGGRIIGEACHFIDWMRYIVGARIVSVHAASMDDGGVYSQDNVSATFRFADGSIGTMLYLANGDSRLPKERAEVFGHRSAAVLDDYRAVTIYAKGDAKVHKLGAQDKGHRAELLAFTVAVRDGGSAPIASNELFEVTEAAIAVLDSIATGLSVPVTLR